MTKDVVRRFIEEHADFKGDDDYEARRLFGLMNDPKIGLTVDEIRQEFRNLRQEKSPPTTESIHLNGEGLIRSKPRPAPPKPVPKQEPPKPRRVFRSYARPPIPTAESPPKAATQPEPARPPSSAPGSVIDQQVQLQPTLPLPPTRGQDRNYQNITLFLPNDLLQTLFQRTAGQKKDPNTLFEEILRDWLYKNNA